MKKVMFGTIALVGMAAISSAATVSAAPSGPSSVNDTINQLQSQGFHVILNRVGTAPLSQCTVGAVRPGQTFSRTDSGQPGAGNDIVTTVTDKSVYVDVTC